MPLKRLIVIFKLSIFLCHYAAAEEEVSSPLRVAQCRATCLEKFAAAPPGGESSCLQVPDCFMCWENCELLQSNYQVWGALCEEKDICFPGCKVACKFHEEASKAEQKQPVIHTKGEGVMRVSGALARWPPPAPRAAARPMPLVYVVMRRASDGPWRQIIQTEALATRVPSNNEGALLRVLVVDSQGLVTIYSPDETWAGHDSNTIINEEKWTLKEVSLIHQKVLVIGEIAWEPRIARGVYLVTWEVNGGGLKGNLFTDSTRVTLSLWPNTIYHIQVELVSRTPGVANEKSETMTMDTRRAQKVSTESVQDVQMSDGDRLMSVLVSSMRGERAPETSHSELVFGCLAALILFSFALILAVFWQRRRRDTFPGTNVYVGSSSVLKKKLVEDFVPTSQFQPVLGPKPSNCDRASGDVVV